MAYEKGMFIVFDAIERSAVVSFRGTVTLLKGPISDRRQAISIGEAHCRNLGWVDEPELPIRI